MMRMDLEDRSPKRTVQWWQAGGVAIAFAGLAVAGWLVQLITG